MLIGYVGQHLKMSEAPNGTKKVMLRVATHETDSKNKNNGDNTTWHNVIAWGGLADIAACNFVKGSRIRVHGAIYYRSYRNKDGHLRQVTEIKAEFLQNLDR